MALLPHNLFSIAFVLGSVALGTVACAPRDLESAPVTVATPKGDVVCQLYTRDMIYWDRAISVPAGMSSEQADKICLARGEELKRSGS